MDAGKTLRAIGGAVVFFGLALVLALLMLLSVFAGMGSAEAQCAQQSQSESLFGYPTDRQQIDGDWTFIHKGYDFKVDEDAKVYASHDGKVVKASDGEVRIRREQVETRYKPMKTITVRDGAEVKRGDPIGTTGILDEGTDGQGAPIGYSGVHLHWEMWVDKENNNDWSIAPIPEENPFIVQTPEGGDPCNCIDGNLSGSNNQQKAFNFFVQNGFSKEQAAGIVGNMIAESSVEPQRLQNTDPGVISKPADVVDSPLGWGIVQWTPAGKMINPSRDDGVQDEVIGSLAYQLEFLLKQLRGQGPLPEKPAGDALKAATTVEQAAYEFGHRFERFLGHENPNHQTYVERKANARRVFDQFAGSAPAGGGANPASTGGGCGAGSGNIAEVAKNLAWPEGGHDGTDASLAKPEFVAAMEEYNDGSSGYLPYSDCGRFVATVMRMSGADPEFPKVSTGVQFDYMQSSGKYDYWHGEPPGGMKPGDILNGPGHTYLYVGPWGKEGGGYNSASGSLGQHVPEATHLYGVGGQFWVFRLKNAPQAAS
ncbi:phage tail tip lysozyme [Kribbella sp. HUAS MG21]|uniref:Phage tail tip lysozyme n=1 Tax=Kribbella sp. HUAS MG21 TaxID=3160966 RepID=A0AAU7TL42_9ACTN